jgi:acyl-CoA dehydrogenase
VSHSYVASEEILIAGKSAGTCVGVGTHAIALPPIVRHGTEDQKRRFVAPVLAGEKIAALGITEPGAGSDVAGLQTRAVRDSDHYLVNGSKTFSGRCATRICALAGNATPFECRAPATPAFEG